MSNPSRALLDACLESREGDALNLIASGRGLRHHCQRSGIEPLGACARNGMELAFHALLDRSFFDPHESALDEAMREAAIHGHPGIALAAWRIGACLDYESIGRAIDQGQMDCLERLSSEGALSSHAPRDGFPSEADYLMQAYCARGCDALAAACLRRGCRLEGERAQEAAADIAEQGLGSAAQAWLEVQGEPPAVAAAAWERVFPALMQSRRDRLAIEAALVAGPAPTARARL